MNTKSISKSILALFVTATLVTSCTSTKNVAETKVNNTKTTVKKKAYNAVATVDSVKFVEGINHKAEGQILNVDVNYSATTDRDLVAELKDSSGTWLGGGKIEVTKGTGTSTIRVWSKNPIVAGDDYLLLVSIRPSGTNWKETIVKDVITPFSVK